MLYIAYHRSLTPDDIVRVDVQVSRNQSLVLNILEDSVALIKPKYINSSFIKSLLILVVVFSVPTLTSKSRFLQNYGKLLADCSKFFIIASYFFYVSLEFGYNIGSILLTANIDKPLVKGKLTLKIIKDQLKPKFLIGNVFMFFVEIGKNFIRAGKTLSEVFHIIGYFKFSLIFDSIKWNLELICVPGDSVLRILLTLWLLIQNILLVSNMLNFYENIFTFIKTPSLIIRSLYFFYLIFIGFVGFFIGFLIRFLSRFQVITNLYFLILFLLNIICYLIVSSKSYSELIELLAHLTNSKSMALLSSVAVLDPVQEKKYLKFLKLFIHR